MKWIGVIVLVHVICVGFCCHDGWLTHGEKCYHFSRDTETWADASVMCQIMKGKLVEIEDQAENNYLKTQARMQGSNNYWIGLWDVIEEGSWTWTGSGTPLTTESFTDWSAGQPDNKNTHEDCGMLYSVHSYQWNDAPCHVQTNYICEQENSSEHIIG